MKLHIAVLLVAAVTLSNAAMAQNNISDGATFSFDQIRLSEAKPWTSKDFQGDPGEFQFIVIGDRTGGANAQGTFVIAVD